MAEPQKVQIRGTAAIVKPLFADEVMLGITVKATKTEDGVIKKEGLIRLSFLDVVRGQLLSEVVITPTTAKSLAKILNNDLKRMDKELKSKKLPEKPLVKEETTGYIY